MNSSSCDSFYGFLWLFAKYFCSVFNRIGTQILNTEFFANTQPSPEPMPNEQQRGVFQWVLGVNGYSVNISVWPWDDEIRDERGSDRDRWSKRER
jgi:hypothetical protein